MRWCVGVPRATPVSGFLRHHRLLFSAGQRLVSQLRVAQLHSCKILRIQGLILRGQQVYNLCGCLGETIKIVVHRIEENLPSINTPASCPHSRRYHNLTAPASELKTANNLWTYAQT